MTPRSRTPEAPNTVASPEPEGRATWFGLARAAMAPAGADRP